MRLPFFPAFSWLGLVDRRLCFSFILVIGLISCGQPPSLEVPHSFHIDSRKFTFPAKQTSPIPEKLHYVNGFILSSQDPDFGGISGMTLLSDPKNLITISDRGYWISLKLIQDSSGALIGIEPEATLSPLYDFNGKPVSRQNSDAEGLTAGEVDGAYYVSFEHNHRIRLYQLDKDDFSAEPQWDYFPPEAVLLEPNTGFEVLAMHPSGRLLFMAEQPLPDETSLTGWWGQINPDPSLKITETGLIRIRRQGLFVPTDGVFARDGTFFLLERRFTLLGGFAMRIRKFLPGTLEPTHPADGETLIVMDTRDGIDNMEAISLAQATDGGLFLYVMSDDNLMFFEKTLLLQFYLPPSS